MKTPSHLDTNPEKSLLTEPIAKGKTKEIHQHVDDQSVVFIQSRDDITAGNGAMHDTIVGKSVYATITNSNVMNLLGQCGIQRQRLERSQISRRRSVYEDF